jgi:hypothetical protein
MPESRDLSTILGTPIAWVEGAEPGVETKARDLIKEYFVKRKTLDARILSPLDLELLVPSLFTTSISGRNEYVLAEAPFDEGSYSEVYLGEKVAGDDKK